MVTPPNDLADLLSVQPDQGLLLLGGRRMLMISHRSLGLLGEVVGAHLGDDLTYALFAQFGYRCGVDDYATLAAADEQEGDPRRRALPPEGDLAQLVRGGQLPARPRQEPAARVRVADRLCLGLGDVVLRSAVPRRRDPVCRLRPRSLHVRDSSRGGVGPEAAPWRNALQATTASAAVDTPAPGGAPVRDLGQIESALDHHAILAITDQRGRIVHVNDHFCAISKYRRDELLGRDQRLINSGTHSREFMRHLWRTITGGTVWHGEICNRAKDGTLYWVETTIYPVAGPHGSPVQYVSLRTDISRRKFAEARAREERDRAALLARDAIKASQAKSDFLATMSHEIRTPLNGVLGFTTLLTETTLNEDQRLCVDTIHSSGQALLEIVNDILDYSKIESGRLVLERAPYDLHALIADVVARHEVRATEKGVSLRIVDGDAPTYLMGDEGRVRQVLINLVSNAVKFTPCGAVTVAASRHDHAVRVTVTDTGIGIPADRVDRLFQPFSQADGSTTRRFGGTGLGLAISRHLVELMGGRIGVESDESTGSTFWFDVPDTSPEGTHAQGALTEAQRALPGGRPAGRRLRVLVADDVPVNRLLAKRILESLDASVELAANGSQAVAMAVLAPYDLILMDCHMPMMDGYAAARAIRSHEAEAHSVATPIVALTANVMDRQRDDCRAAGMDDVVVKPITKAALAGALTRWT